MSCSRQSRLARHYFMRYLFLFQRVRPMITIVLPLIVVTLISTSTMAASVSVSWNPNDPTPDGYIILFRTDGSDYNYDAPSWMGSATSCRLDGLIPGTTYFMVVRAYAGALQSADSNEVSFTTEEDSGDTTESENTSNEVTKRVSARMAEQNGENTSERETNADIKNDLTRVTQLKISASD